MVFEEFCVAAYVGFLYKICMAMNSDTQLMKTVGNRTDLRAWLYEHHWNCLLLCQCVLFCTTDCSGMKYFVSEVRVGGACWFDVASSSSSSVRKGLMFCGFMARERVRENPDQT